jgi:hypothetical protein
LLLHSARPGVLAAAWLPSCRAGGGDAGLATSTFLWLEFEMRLKSLFVASLHGALPITAGWCRTIGFTAYYIELRA